MSDGYVATNGYRYIYIGRNRDGKPQWILAHRLLMEWHLGRALLTNEHIHHINGDRLDNRIENLRMLHPSDHRRLEWASASDEKRAGIVGPAHAATERLLGRRLTTPAARAIAVHGYHSGVPVRKIAADFGVPTNRIYRWIWAAGVSTQRRGPNG